MPISSLLPNVGDRNGRDFQSGEPFEVKMTDIDSFFSPFSSWESFQSTVGITRIEIAFCSNFEDIPAAAARLTGAPTASEILERLYQTRAAYLLNLPAKTKIFGIHMGYVLDFLRAPEEAIPIQFVSDENGNNSLPVVGLHGVTRRAFSTQINPHSFLKMVYPLTIWWNGGLERQQNMSFSTSGGIIPHIRHRVPNRMMKKRVINTNVEQSDEGMTERITEEWSVCMEPFVIPHSIRQRAEAHRDACLRDREQSANYNVVDSEDFLNILRNCNAAYNTNESRQRATTGRGNFQFRAAYDPDRILRGRSDLSSMIGSTTTSVESAARATAARTRSVIPRYDNGNIPGIYQSTYQEVIRPDNTPQPGAPPQPTPPSIYGWSSSVTSYNDYFVSDSDSGEY